MVKKSTQIEWEMLYIKEISTTKVSFDEDYSRILFKIGNVAKLEFVYNQKVRWFFF